MLTGKQLRPPSLADEAALLKYYKGRVQELCRAFGFPAKVQAAAITFLSRFYLRHSPLQYAVKDTMLACLYLAGKVTPPDVTLGAPCEKGKGCRNVMLAYLYLTRRTYPPLLPGDPYHTAAGAEAGTQAGVREDVTPGQVHAQAAAQESLCLL